MGRKGSLTGRSVPVQNGQIAFEDTGPRTNYKEVSNRNAVFRIRDRVCSEVYDFRVSHVASILTLHG